MAKKPAPPPKKAAPKKDLNHESYRYDWRQRAGLKRGTQRGC